jgi:hypothetical protein
MKRSMINNSLTFDELLHENSLGSPRESPSFRNTHGVIWGLIKSYRR